MLILSEPKGAIAQWVLDQVKSKGRFFDDFKTIGVFDGARLLGAVVYDGFTERDCELHICLHDRRAVSRRTIRAVFDYPFRQLRLERVSANVLASNEASHEFVQRLGFQLEGRKRFKGESVLMYGLMRHECKWLDSHEYKFAEMLKNAT